MAPRSLAAFALVALLAAGCGGASGRFDGGVYRDGPIAFQIGEVPPSWRKVDVNGASLAWRDDASGASVLVNARCNKPDMDTPLQALTNQLLIGSTEREIALQETEPFDRREALHTRLRAKWDGVPLALDVFVMKKDGCTYDFVFTSPPNAFEQGAPAFERFVRGFHTLGGAGTA